MKQLPPRCQTTPPAPPGFTALLALALPGLSLAADVPSRMLSDKIYQGDGIIDLLKDIGGTDLSRYFSQTGEELIVGVNLKVAPQGHASNQSAGVAITQARLSIHTTKGDFNFQDFCTVASAMPRKPASPAPRPRATERQRPAPHAGGLPAVPRSQDPRRTRLSADPDRRPSVADRGIPDAGRENFRL